MSRLPMLFVLAAAVAESTLASRYLGTQREESQILHAPSQHEEERRADRSL